MFLNQTRKRFQDSGSSNNVFLLKSAFFEINFNRSTSKHTLTWFLFGLLALKKLNRGFKYSKNPNLCGVGFPGLNACTANLDRPEPFQPSNISGKDLPESANLESDCSRTHCSRTSKSSQIGLVLGVIGVFVAIAITTTLMFSWYRRRKQKIGSTFDTSNSRLSTDETKEVYKKKASPLINLEYSNGWDPLAKGGNGFSQEILESFMLNLEEVERATKCFSEANLLGKNSFSAVYKGLLRDGSVVVIKCIAKTSCKSDEADFLKGLKILISLKHENLVRLRGFCCSKGRGECCLIYDFIPNGSLLQYLDIGQDNRKALKWSSRVSIIHDIAKG